MGRRPGQTLFQRGNVDGQHTHENILNITNHQGNANQNYNEVSNTLYLSEWLSSKRMKIINVSEAIEKMEPSYTISGNKNWYSNWKIVR